MNYRIINKAILSSQDVLQSIDRDNKFYDYLLNNGMAYYYSAYLSKDKNILDKRIIKAGNILNSKYINTLKIIDKICRENEINFLLFKSYKYFHEIVDNDIDLFIKEKDFHIFTKAFAKDGFKCFIKGPLQAECIKEGFCKIEPRVTFSFRGRVILKEERIWENQVAVNINGIKISKTSKEIDLLYLLLSILYTPNYLKLYLLKLFKESDVEKLYILSSNEQINQDIKFLIKNLIEKAEEKHLPSFLGNINFIRWWYRRVFLSKDIYLIKKTTLILFFFYSKFSYIFFNKLVFKHKWPLN